MKERKTKQELYASMPKKEDTKCDICRVEKSVVSVVATVDLCYDCAVDSGWAE